MSSEKTPQNLDEIIKLYLEKQSGRNIKDGALELEVRFGTKGIKRISHINYDNVVQRLLSLGFELTPSESLLRITNEFIDQRGVTKMSNIRTEIKGLGPISDYCKNDTITNNEGISLATFEQKSLYHLDGKPVYPVNFDDFNFRAALNIETEFYENSGLIRSMIEKWNDSKKVFRYINRCSLSNSHYPVRSRFKYNKIFKKKRQEISSTRI